MRPRLLYFITHPNVVISRDVPDLTSIYCSTEQKAIDGTLPANRSA